MREVCPRDFYWFAILENDFPDLGNTAKGLLLIALLTDAGEEVLDQIPGWAVLPLTDWMAKELINERVMKVEKWTEMAFHLCKQRWDDSIDWLEQQPMSKILLMVRIQNKFNEEQNREMKKSARRK